MLAVDAFVRLIPIIQNDIPKYVANTEPPISGNHICRSLNALSKLYLLLRNRNIIKGTKLPGTNRNPAIHNSFETSP